jgi:hypothetical protein
MSNFNMADFEILILHLKFTPVSQFISKLPGMNEHIIDYTSQLLQK